MVFPEPVAPLMRKLSLDATMRSSTDWTRLPQVPVPNMPSRLSSGMEKTVARRIRTLRRVPAVEMGGSTACTR